MRTFAAVVLTFLGGIIVGRLVLERTGTGLVTLAFLLPVVFLVASAAVGFGRAAILLALFAGTALLVRVIVVGAGWVVLLLVPAIALSAYIVANTVKAMVQGEGKEE